MSSPSRSVTTLPWAPPPTPDQLGPRNVERGRRAVFALVALAVSALVGFGLVQFPLIIFVGAFGALLATAVVVMRPFVGLLLYAFLYILRPGEMVPVLAALHLERIVGVLTLIGIFLGMYRRQGELLFDSSAQTRWLWLFVASVILSVPMSFWPGHSVSTLVDLLKIVAFYLMIVYLVDSRKRLRIFVWTYVLLILYLGVSSLWSYFAGKLLFSQGIDRAVGVTDAGGGANEMGATMATTFPVLVLLAIAARRLWLRFVIGASALMCTYVMVLTGSRAALLGFLMGALVLWWNSKKRLLLGVVGAGLLVCGFLVMPKQYQERYGTVTHTHLDGSSQYRLITWLTGLEMIMDRPIFGVGAGCFGAARGMAYSDGMRRSFIESHSLYIQVLAEIGVIGAIAFFGFVTRFIKLNRGTRALLARAGPEWKWERLLLYGVFVGTIVLLVSGIFGHSLFRRTWYLYAALGLAVLRVHEPAGSRTETS